MNIKQFVKLNVTKWKFMIPQVFCRLQAANWTAVLYDVYLIWDNKPMEKTQPTVNVLPRLRQF